MTRSYPLSDYVVRVGAMAIDAIKPLRSPALESPLRELLWLDAELRSAQDDVSTALSACVPLIADVPVRRRAIQLRRDLYNGRASPNHGRIIGELPLSQDNRTQVIRYNERLLVRREAHAELHRSFEATRRNERLALDEACSAPLFQLGLVLASPSLFDAQSIPATDPRSDLFGDARRVELGLLRYLTRTTTKATPFGTFCVVLRGRLSERHAPSRSAIAIYESEHEPTIVVRLNRGLLATFVGQLSKHPEARQHLYLTLNPTVQADNGKYRFLAGSWHHEAFRYIDATPPVRFVYDIVSGDTRIRYGDLIDRLVNDVQIDTDAATALLFCDELLHAGFLSLATGVSPHTVDWDVALDESLTGCDDPAAQAVSRCLRALRTTLDNLPEAAPGEWRVRLADMGEEVAHCLSLLGNDQPVRPASLLRVDAVHPTAHFDLSLGADGRALVERLSSYILYALRLAAPRVSQANMRHFLDNLFPSEEQVSLLEFHEQYYRHHFKELIDLRRRSARGEHLVLPYDLNNPFEIPFVARIMDTLREVGLVMVNAWQRHPHDEEVVIPIEEVTAIMSRVQASPWAFASVAMLGNIVHDSADATELRFCTKDLGFSLGFGHMFSRWLDLLPDTVLKTVSDSNDTVSDVLLAEIVGEGLHNANMHPQVLRAHIPYPGTESGALPQQCPPSELVIRRHPSDLHSLILVHGPSNRQIVPVDLGFVAIDLRPPLYRLLADFSPLGSLQVPIPYLFEGQVHRAIHEAINRRNDAPADGALITPDHHQTSRVHYRPRICLGPLVLCRRSWATDVAQLPGRTGGETDFNYWLRLRQWQLSEQIPTKAFFHFEDSQPILRGEVEERPRSTESDGSSEKSLRSRLNERKPQYIDFESTLLVNLLSHALSKTGSRTIVFEECYPHSEMLPRGASGCHASEAILQFELRAGEA